MCVCVWPCNPIGPFKRLSDKPIYAERFVERIKSSMRQTLSTDFNWIYITIVSTRNIDNGSFNIKDMTFYYGNKYARQNTMKSFN